MLILVLAWFVDSLFFTLYTFSQAFTTGVLPPVISTVGSSSVRRSKQPRQTFFFQRYWTIGQDSSEVAADSSEKCVLKSFANLTGKHLCRSHSKKNPTQVFTCEFCEVF